MEVLVEKLTKEVIDLSIEKAKNIAEIALLRKHIEGLNTMFSKPFVVALPDEQIQAIAQQAAQIIKGVSGDLTQVN